MFLVFFASSSGAQPSAQSSAAFDAYVRNVERRLESQHHSAGTFLALPNGQAEKDLNVSSFVLERLTPGRFPGLDGALLEHWRGTAFVPGATAEQFDDLLRNISSYPKYFAPQILRASEEDYGPETRTVSIRIREEHILTIVLDGSYAVEAGQLDKHHRYSTSRSVQIREIARPGTSKERVLGPGTEAGWLWRMNTYWTYEQRGEGLYLQIETVTLSRSVPRSLGWLVGPYVEAIPRESLAFTLRSVRNALLQPNEQRK